MRVDRRLSATARLLPENALKEAAREGNVGADGQEPIPVWLGLESELDGTILDWKTEKIGLRTLQRHWK
jgi:hypothetical protein